MDHRDTFGLPRFPPNLWPRLKHFLNMRVKSPISSFFFADFSYALMSEITGETAPVDLREAVAPQGSLQWLWDRDCRQIDMFFWRCSGQK